MDIVNKKSIDVVMGLLFFCMSFPLHAATGYFQLHNLMSFAQKNLPSNLFFNDAKLNLENIEKNTGHVVNTQFANDGGMAGCGVTSTLIHYMYQNAGTNDFSKNYIALNVYSQLSGFDNLAPFWGDPEGQVKGYLTQGSSRTNVAYPFTPYHRVIPSVYPAYLGSYNNGLNCGRWIEADFDVQACNDRTTDTGISKSCPDMPNLSYAGQSIKGYVFDSCEDNNGWCRDDAAHIDVNQSAFTNPANYYLQWKFIRNPYYSDPKAPASLKDIWLAWFGQASKYWSYVAILNTENGLSKVQYNIGDVNNPVWVSSHVLAGDNNVTWSSSSNNGQLWQVEPVNSLTDAAPADNPLYQLKMFDYLGYPANHGSIYQFKLLFDDGTLGQNVSGFSLFYQGGAQVKPGTQMQNMTILSPPSGTGKITVAFNQLLPSNISLDPSQTNYLRPVLISSSGYSWDAAQCLNNKCVFTNLPTQDTYTVFAHAIDDVSNDLTLRKVNDIAISSANISFPAGSTVLSYSLKTSEINLSTLYSARVKVPLKFAATSNVAINGNLQALFVPDNTKNATNNITAQTQGCFLNTYVNTITDPNHVIPDYRGNDSICTIYYTVNHQTSFLTTAAPPSAFFNVKLPTKVGIDPVNYLLTSPNAYPVQVTGYNPSNTSLPNLQNIPLSSYGAGTGTARTLYLMLDGQSDGICLQNLDPNAGVSVSVGGAAPIHLTQADIPLETELTQPTSDLSTQVNTGTSPINCQAMPAIVPTPANLLTPGLDVLEIIKLTAFPKSSPPTPSTQGIAAVANGDTNCLGGSDILTFSNSNGAAVSIPYTPSAASTNVSIPATGTYTITDKPFVVSGGSCQLSSTPTVTIQGNTYTPITLNYQFNQTPTSACTATVQVSGTWPNGCNIQMTINSPSLLNNVTLSWLKGAWDWTHAQIWSGTGQLIIPTDANGKVLWKLAAWINGQNSTVGMTINSDSSPAICSAFTGPTPLVVQCAGTAISKSKKRPKAR